jgi:hypothetical protein
MHANKACGTSIRSALNLRFCAYPPYLPVSGTNNSVLN